MNHFQYIYILYKDSYRDVFWDWPPFLTWVKPTLLNISIKTLARPFEFVINEGLNEIKPTVTSKHIFLNISLDELLDFIIYMYIPIDWCDTYNCFVSHCYY